MLNSRRGFLANAAVAAPASRAPKRKSNSLEERLRGALAGIECIDTHEHIYPEKTRVSQDVDLFRLASHYLFDDLVCAGMTEDAKQSLTSKDASESERWRAFEPFWKSVRMTGYGQALRIAVRDLYGFEEISAATLPGINQAIRRMNRPGLYEEVLRKRARVRLALVEPGWRAAPVKPDQPFFVLSRQFDRYIMVRDRHEVRELEEATGVSITGLGALKLAAERNFARSLELGMVAVKTTLAYHRDLQFHRVAESAAERDLQALLRGERETPKGRARFENRPFRNLEDYMLRHVVALAAAHRLPVQVHTGSFAGHWNYVANSNPTHLTNLFFDFPNVRFDLFHMSYPYQSELAAITKLFPNVYADFCWAYVLSPPAAGRALREFIETVPLNKILGFGGDYWFPELSYAHLVMARRTMARVFAELVEDGLASETEAIEMGRMILHDNAAALFALPAAGISAGSAARP